MNNGFQGYPNIRSLQFKRYFRTSGGDLSLGGSTSWANVSTASDLTLDAQIGDTIELGLNTFWGNEAKDGYIDIVTVVSGTPINSVGSGVAVTTSPPKYGIPAWRGPSGSNVNISGSVFYVVQAGDLDNNKVTFRLRYATDSGGGSKTLFGGGTNYNMQFIVKNLGVST